MLVHPWDAPVATGELVAFARSQGFGHLVAPGQREVPVVVPTQFVLDDARDGGFPDVLLHLARPNPIWSALEESTTVVLSVAGDWAYVPAAWKAVADEDPSLGIPTTYYAAVQVVADAEVLTAPDDVLAVLRRQLAVLEPDGGAADPSVHERKLPGIRGLRLRPREVTGKLKYGGNVDLAHRLSVAERLADRDGAGDVAAREHLLRRSADLLLHITTPDEWERAQQAGVFTESTRDATLDDVGFIHTSRVDQVERVADFLYADHPGPLVVLHIDATRLDVPVVVEDGGAGELFPHVYGPVPVDAVVAVRPLHGSTGADGRTTWSY